MPFDSRAVRVEGLAHNRRILARGLGRRWADERFNGRARLGQRGVESDWATSPSRISGFWF